MLSPSSPLPDFCCGSSGLTFSDIPSTLSLVFDSAGDVTSLCPPTLAGDDAVLSSSLESCVFSSSSFLSPCNGLLGPATTVEGSAVSRALNSTYTVHHGSCRCLCRSRQNDLVRFVFLHAAQTGVFGSKGFFTQNGCHWTIRTVNGLSTYRPSSPVHDSSKVRHMYAVVHGAVVCVFLTRHISLVLKFFLHFSQTANRESGNFTFKDCLNPGGVKVRMF